MLGDLGGAFSVPTGRIGYRLGLFETLHKHGPVTADELAAQTGLAKRYVREWALAQASNGYIVFHSATDQFSLTPEQAMVFRGQGQPGLLGRRLRFGGRDRQGSAQGGERFPNRESPGAKVAAAYSAPSARSSGRVTSMPSGKLGCRLWIASHLN
jgi:hypothetical protein